MAIPDDIIERIRVSNDILSIVREYIPDIKRAGRNWKACCPFHNEKTPSFIVSPEKNIFRCFGCNESGDVFKFVMLMDKISWIEAVRKLAIKANIEIKETKQERVKLSEKTKLFEILENSARFYHRHFMENAGAEIAREYIKNRGINLETVKSFMIGYAPKGKLIQSALKKGYTIEDLSNAGIITKTDRGTFFEYMQDRVVFPIFDVQGRVVGFGGRTLDDKQQPKYLNTPETSVYSKSSNLYGLFQTIAETRKERKIIVLEGYMDVIIPQQFGISGTVATLGTAFTNNHARLISRYADNVTLLFDSDDAGRTAAQRALEICVENSIECKVASLPEKVDADEFLNKYGREEFLKLLDKTSQSAIDFMINRVISDTGKDSAESKAKAVSALLDFVKRSDNIIVKREWVKNISQNLNIDENAVWSEVKRRERSQFRSFTDTKNRHDKIDKNIKKVAISVEENLLNLILNDRSLITKVSQDCFQEARCEKVYGMIISGLSDAEILNSLSGEDKSWFSALTLKGAEHKNPEEALRIFLKDIEIDRLKKRRQVLEKEVILMTEGKLERDYKKLEEYKKLTSLLKGSGK